MWLNKKQFGAEWFATKKSPRISIKITKDYNKIHVFMV
jgi:hypothetical protein